MAREHAWEPDSEGLTIVADQQTGGRGSHGRVWESPPGTDLYVSLVTRPRVAAPSLPPLTLAVGLAVAETVDAALRSDNAMELSQVKWPNDVLLDGRKCAGVLVEAQTTEANGDPVVVGVGLNVNRLHFPTALEGRAVSLLGFERSRNPKAQCFDRAAVLAGLLTRLERWVDAFEREGPSTIAGALSSRLAYRGQSVTCDAVAGTLEGVAPSGAIQIRTPSGVVSLHTGTLRRG